MGGALYAGGIVGSLGTLSSIKRCYAVGIVQSETTSDYSNSGGIAGSSEGSIENCYVYTMVSSSSSYGETAGGIAGINDGTMDKCYAIGAVQCRGTDPYTQIGGIAGGEWSGGGQVNNCISLVSTLDGGPSASINKTVHAIMGSNSYTTLTGNYSRNDIDIINRTDSDDPGSSAKDGEGKPLNNFQSPAIYTTAGWNFTTGTGDWKFISGYDFPVLSWQTFPPDLSAVPDSFVIIWP
jgi:hypothetical protein